MPISKLKVNSRDREGGEPLVDLELDLSPEEIAAVSMAAHGLIARAKELIAGTGLGDLIKLKLNVQQPPRQERPRVVVEDPGNTGNTGNS
jgi:hypothetical protein